MHTIKSVGVLSVAKIMGAIYALIGLIFLPIFLLLGFVGSIAGDTAIPSEPLAGWFLVSLPQSSTARLASSEARSWPFSII